MMSILLTGSHTPLVDSLYSIRHKLNILTIYRYLLGLIISHLNYFAMSSFAPKLIDISVYLEHSAKISVTVCAEIRLSIVIGVSILRIILVSYISIITCRKLL